MTEPIESGGYDIQYRWYVNHDPARSCFDLYMYRYKVGANGYPIEQWALSSASHWVPIEPGTAAVPTLYMPDILVHELGEQGVVNLFDGKKAADEIAKWCARLIAGVTEQAQEGVYPDADSQ